MQHEKIPSPNQVSESYNSLLALEPKLITNYVPANKTEEKEAFLEGKIRNPDHHYPRLDDIDFDAQLETIAQTGAQIVSNPTLNPKHEASYKEFIDGYTNKTRLMRLACDYKAAQDSVEKERIGREYEALNIELYGKPDEMTYRSLLQEKLNLIAHKNLTGHAEKLRNELFTMAGFNESQEIPERFKPSSETVEWMHEVVTTLYDGMLSHVPEQVEFSEHEAKNVFEEIIREEFGEAAEGWTVDVEEAKSINVKSAEKRIIIPDDRGSITRNTLRKLIVHEIGVHMLRSVTGGETDLEPLRNGLSDYYDSEEGLGVVMEQALTGKFVEAGIDHYITAGAAYYDRKDFRDIFELKWRLGALSSLKDDGELTEEAIKKAKQGAYGGTMRILRGTDELPWFKDLAYYNGSVNMWRHLEEIKGDDVKFMFVLMGKANPASSAHERILYETATP